MRSGAGAGTSRHHVPGLSMVTSSGGAKKPPGLSISIPHAPDGDPLAGPPTNGSLTLSVLRDLLTPSELVYANEINSLNLPVQIQLTDDPPLTSCRGQLQKVWALCDV